jgi:hypothetical protein
MSRPAKEIGNTICSYESNLFDGRHWLWGKVSLNNWKNNCKPLHQFLILTLKRISHLFFHVTVRWCTHKISTTKQNSLYLHKNTRWKISQEHLLASIVKPRNITCFQSSPSLFNLIKPLNCLRENHCTVTHPCLDALFCWYQCEHHLSFLNLQYTLHSKSLADLWRKEVGPTSCQLSRPSFASL